MFQIKMKYALKIRLRKKVFRIECKNAISCQTVPQFLIFITCHEFMPVFSSHKHDWMIGLSIHGPLNNGRVCSKLVFISLLRTGTLNIQEAERNSGPVWLFAYSYSVLLTPEFLMGNDGNGRSVTTIRVCVLHFYQY